MLCRWLHFMSGKRQTNSDTFMKLPVKFDESVHMLEMPLSDTHHAGLGTAVHVPKFIILVVWAQCSVAKLVFWFGSCLENLELEFAQPI